MFRSPTDCRNASASAWLIRLRRTPDKKKGAKLYVEGQIVTRKWNDKGHDNYTTEIVLKGYNGTIELLDSKPAESSQPAANDAAPIDEGYADFEADIAF